MGTITFRNNQKFLANKKIHRITEYPLFTDVPRIVGELSNSKEIPYATLNPIVDYHQAIVLPRIVLRVFDYIDYQEDVSKIQKMDFSKPIKSNFETHTSLSIHEEITAILSLVLGIRLKAGKQCRSFEPSSLGKDDYFGSILNMNSHENPVPMRLFYSGLKIPNAIRYKSKENVVYLNKAEKYLTQLVKINDKKSYAALIRSAKLYSNALWICESDPENAWLLLISAIETAASSWKKEKYDEVKLFRSEYKTLAALIDNSCSNPSVIKEIAKCLHLRASQNFIDFIKKFYRKPRNSQKNKMGKINWDNYDAILKQIYNLRSLTLHTGQPFPPAMCEHPFLRHSKRATKILEKPISGLSFIGETIIKPEDQPIFLWKFEEIVRTSLLKWLLTLK